MDKATKVCPKCKIEKPRSAFAKHRGEADGLQARCKQCVAEYRRQRVEDGGCVLCTRKALKGFTFCGYHYKKQRDRRRAYREAGRCVQCGTDAIDGSYYCEQHAMEHAARRRKARELGLCSSCRLPATTGFNVCSRCWFRQLACRILGSSKLAIRLERMWEDQGGFCALTGVKLEQGIASLDHIKHRSRGGKNDPSNLRWVHKVVNEMRGDRTDAELFQWCKLLLKKTG